MAKKENKSKLGCNKGYTNASDGDAVNPVNNELAISQWHAALGRVIAYVWDHWDDEDELDFVLKFPEYYLAKFGFYPQIPAYQTKIKFVIKHNDTVLYKYGGPDENDTECSNHEDNCDDHSKGATVSIFPRGDRKNGRTVVMNRAMDYLSTKNEYTAGLVPLTTLDDPMAEIKDTLGVDDAALANGWQFDEVNELTGCFIVAIPPKPEAHDGTIADQALLEAQALGDFMDICRSQPFTCS